MNSTCPRNGSKGKLVPLQTLKSLLIHEALEQIHPEFIYCFCESVDCSVVYFSEQQQVFTTLQRNSQLNVMIILTMQNLSLQDKSSNLTLIE
jgi:hypothetical protein